MIYLMEDKADDMLCKLFKSAYKSETIKNFIYTNGNGSLHMIAESKLKETSEEVVVYLDTVPGNDSIRKIYYKLASLSRNYHNRLIILPIICIEYYFIKSIQNTHLTIDIAEIARCVNKEPYFDSMLISSEEDRKFCINFEKYCKLVLRKNVIDCAKNSRCLDVYGEVPNTQYEEYCTQDCLCKHTIQECITKHLTDKSLDLLIQYPCVPSNANTSSNKTLSREALQSLHRKLVDEFNEVVQKFKDIDIENASTYKTISYTDK